MSASRSDASRTEKRSVKTRKLQVADETQHQLAPWINLEDGNADKEAEKLMPSPNFYVLVVCSRVFGVDALNFIGCYIIMNVARLNDALLGSFALVPSSETLDHLVRYLSTWSGSDKLFMIIQYAIKLIVPLLNARARIQHRVGLRNDPTSSAAQAWTKLGGIVSDSRMLWRIWGLLPIFQWLISLERNPPPTRKLLTIERLQGWSMLAYYPMEHIYYLCSHEIIPSSIPSPLSLFSSAGKPMPVNAGAIGKWSCRFWALYVVLQFAHLQDDRKLLLLRERSLSKAKGKAPAITGEMEELRKRWDSFWNEVIVNIGYLPLTIHWSLENGLFDNEIFVGVFGLIAALASFRSGWKATELPSAGSTSDIQTFDVESSSMEQVTQPADCDVSS